MPPETLNSTADDQYVATNQRRSDVANAQNQITRIEAMKPDEKRAALNNNGFDAGNWAQFKTAFSYPLNQDDRDALEAQRQQVEGGKPAPSTSRPQTEPESGTVIDPHDLSNRWVNFWKEAGATLPDPKDPDFDAKMGKLTETLMNSVVASQPDVAVQGGEASGIVSQIVDRIKKHFEPAAGTVKEAVDVAGKHGEDAINVAADAEGAGGGEGNQPAGASAAESAAALAPKPGEAATGEFAGNVEQGSIAKPFNSRQEAMEAAVKSGGVVSKTRNAAGNYTVEPAKTAAAQAEAPEAHSDIAALQNARENPMTHEEMQAIEVEGEEGHQLPKSPLGYSDLVRAQSYTGSVADRVVSAQRAFLQDGSEENGAALEAAKKTLEEIRPQMRAIWHQAGLTLQKVGAGDPSSAQIRGVFEAMEQNASMPERMAAALANLPSVAERQKMIEDAAAMGGGQGWTAKGALYKLYVNSILSLNSVGKKAASDAANILFQVPARAVAAGISNSADMFGSDFFKGAQGESIDLGETHAMVRGMIENFGSALKAGLDSAAKGRPMFEGDVGFLDNPHAEESLMGGSGFEGSWWGRAIDYYGHLVSVPGRAIIGVDQFSKSMQFSMEFDALAHRQGMVEAAGEGLSGAEQSARASELADGYLKKAPGWMLDQAMQVAKVNTFQQDLEGSLAKADAFRKSSYLTRTLMPFFKTPVNITLQGIRQSPLAPMSGVWRRTVAAGGPEAALAMSKTALGSAIAAYLTYHVLKGNITGGVPSNLKGTMRDDWLHDHEPFSIRSGDGDWHSYQGLEPVSWLLGTVADAAPAWSYMEHGEADRAVGQLGQAVVNEINRQPMWGALHMLVHALDDVDKGRSNSIGEVGSRMIAGLVPSMAANLAGGIDPVRRQTEGVFQEIRNRIPYLKEHGVATLDSFARPVIVPPGFMVNEFPAYVSTTKKPDPVVEEMIRLKNAVGFEPPQTPQSIGPHITADADDPNAQDAVYGAKLSPAEQNRWNELRNNPGKGMPSLYDSIAKMMKDPTYLEASDAQQATQWHQRFTGYQQMGHDSLLNESESVRGRMMAAYVGKGKARTQGRAAGGVASIVAP